MIPNQILKFLYLLLLLFFIFGCNGGNENNDAPETELGEVVLNDSLFGELSEKQQYYQHFIIEIPEVLQNNTDSLFNWIVENQPGGIRFVGWAEDSISLLKSRLDTFDIVQPFFYTNYFEYYDLPKYPYWDASEKNRDLNWTKVFSNDRIGIVNIETDYEHTDAFKTWLADWKKEKGVNFVTNFFEDKNVKTEFEKFCKTIKNSQNMVELDLTIFDTVQLDPFRKLYNFKSFFLVTTSKKTINQQLIGGADFILINMDEESQNNIPYNTWEIKAENRLAFDKSTERILAAKHNFKKTKIEHGIEEQKKIVQLNYLYNSAVLIHNESKLIPFEKAGSKIYSDQNITIKSNLKAENKFKFYSKEIEKSFTKITDEKGIKIIILKDTISEELTKKINELTTEQETIICFSNPLLYDSLNKAPNLVYFPKPKKGKNDYATLVQQLSGQLAFSADFLSKDSLVKGQKTHKTKLARTQPEFCGLSSDTLRNIDYAISSALNGKAFPGCQVIIAKEGCIIYDKSFGYHTYDRQKSVTSTSMYDVASLTKVVSTTLVGMKMYEMNAYNLTDSLAKFLPDSLKDHLRYPSTIRNITFQELFTHKSGMPAGFPVIKYMQYTTSDIGRFDKYFCDMKDDSVFSTEVAENFYLEASYQDSMWLKLNQIWLDPNKPYKYSDVNMNTLYFIFKSIIHNNPSEYGYSFSKKQLKTKDLFVEFLYDKLYKPLGMNRTKYKPLKHYNKNQIVPTEKESFWRKQLLHGHVHDPNAALYGGIGGNAGIFSTTNDLAILAEMLLRKGMYDSKRYLKAETVEKYTASQPGTNRGLGFNKPSINTSAFGCADSAAVQTFGHTGFTGTCIWVDPINKITYIFLSNRVHPKVNNRIYQYGIRKRVHQYVYDARLFH